MSKAVKKTITYPVVNTKGEKVGTMRLNGEIFGIEPHQDVVHQAVVTYLANRRQATAKTKTRAEVRGGGKKPWRQKGTGRARAGSRRSPIWVGGGVTFGPTGEQNYKLSMNKKAHALALRSALSIKAAEKAFIIIDDTIEIEGKTKAAAELLKNVGATGKVLLINDDNKSLLLATRNLPNVQSVGQDNVAVYDLLNADQIVVEKATLVAYVGGLE
ncbi:MAG: 50S ribosomal protein L4 [Bacilli bacterium]|jgi:large subunit ribosomal protein L4|nr:50S ribosomal protein L4 [Bacillota bacterium]NLI51790.1 50S ribosomal protein L4 [Erysipelotrichaceae bacterium]OQC49609.1 MAG: 50S ribosomal protein L4 [Tenericutes bacterium ADurb.Bin024]HOH94809.1 50S ribosomal protein L4 [Bacilli bacterium]TAH59512.1 MAG: 50S ribosomal protein L4 [Bacillota bacterium]